MSNHNGYNGGTPIDDPGGSSVLLTCPSALTKLAGPSKDLIDDGQICTKNNCLSVVVGYDKPFYYQITQLIPDHHSHADFPVFVEQGVGHIECQSDQHILIRDTPHTCTYGADEPNKVWPKGKTPYDLSQTGRQSGMGDQVVTIVTNVIPETLVNAHFLPHSVLVSNDPHVPAPLHIDEDSVLGRLQGDIVPLNREALIELLTPEALRSTISKHTGRQEFAARELRMTRKNAAISSDLISVRPSKVRPNVREGTIRYNDNTKNLEYFNGADWYALKGELINE